MNELTCFYTMFGVDVFFSSQAPSDKLEYCCRAWTNTRINSRKVLARRCSLWWWGTMVLCPISCGLELGKQTLGPFCGLLAQISAIVFSKPILTWMNTEQRYIKNCSPRTGRMGPQDQSEIWGQGLFKKMKSQGIKKWVGEKKKETRSIVFVQDYDCDGWEYG